MKNTNLTNIGRKGLTLLLGLALPVSMLATGCDSILKAAEDDGTNTAAEIQLEEETPVEEEVTIPEYNSLPIEENEVVISESEKAMNAVDFEDGIIGDTPETIEISGAATWVDNDNQDGIRPAEIEVTLIAAVNGTELTADQMQLINLSADMMEQIVTAVSSDEEGGWIYMFTDLPRYCEGEEITYTVTETATNVINGDVDTGYAAAYEGNDIINAHIPVNAMVSASIIWADNNDQDGIRPDEIEVVLTASIDGIELDEEQMEKIDLYDEMMMATLTAYDADQDGSWTYIFTDLPKYCEGKEITYTVTETAADVINGDADNGYAATYEGNNITNTHVPELTEVSVTKVWNDAQYLNMNGYARPASITITLTGYAGDTAVPGEYYEHTLSAGADGSWTYTFTNLPKYYHGTEIKWYANEQAVAGYQGPDGDVAVYGVDISGNTITNTPVFGPSVQAISLVIHKVDADTGAALRGAVFTVYSDAACQHSLGTTSSNAAGNATYTFYAAGTYYVRETQAPDGYTRDSQIYTVVVEQNGTYYARLNQNTGVWERVYSMVFKNGNSITVQDYANTIEIIDEETPLGENPDTGDAGSMILWIGAAGTSFAILFMLTSLAKKRKRQ